MQSISPIFRLQVQNRPRVQPLLPTCADPGWRSKPSSRLSCVTAIDTLIDLPASIFPHHILAPKPSLNTVAKGIPLNKVRACHFYSPHFPQGKSQILTMAYQALRELPCIHTFPAGILYRGCCVLLYTSQQRPLLSGCPVINDVKLDHFVKMVFTKDSNLIKNKSKKNIVRATQSISCRLRPTLRPQGVAPILHGSNNGQQHMLEYLQAQGTHYSPRGRGFWSSHCPWIALWILAGGSGSVDSQLCRSK